MHRQFFVYFSVIPLIVSVSYFEILRFLSVTEIIKMSEILIIWLSVFHRWLQSPLHIWYSFSYKSLHILSIWCFIHKMHDYVEIVHLSAPLQGLTNIEKLRCALKISLSGKQSLRGGKVTIFAAISTQKWFFLPCLTYIF